MNNNLRTILAAVLSMVVLILWQTYFSKPESSSTHKDNSATNKEKVVDEFKFDYEVPKHQLDHVHVWRARNAVNALVYGYGGVKLFPKQLTIDMDLSKPDMTTSISGKFKAVQELANVTAFNTDPFNTWKGAFRECVKLSSKVIDRQKDLETDKRLNTWCTRGKTNPFGEYSIRGAIEGKAYGEKYRDSPQELRRINDFDWLQDKFND